MNLSQLAVFTENLAEMLNSGVPVERAVTVASRCMRDRQNRRFADDFRDALIEGHDLRTRLWVYDVPRVYPAVITCGLLTGRLPEALKSAAYLLNRLIPLKQSLRRCIRFSVAAYLLGLLASLYLGRPVSFFTLFILAVLFLLPQLSVRAKYLRDMFLAKLPFAGTWLRQLSVLEFTLCFEIVYDSSLDAREMLSESIDAIGNMYLRRRAQPALDSVTAGQTFAEALSQVPYVPARMIYELEVGEISGTLDQKLHWLAGQMRQLIDAKIEPIRALAVAIVIYAGLVPVLMIILPLLLPQYPTITAALGVFGAYATLSCARYAYVQYTVKSANVSVWHS